MFSNRLSVALSGALFALGFACLTQAQVPMTGAGLGVSATASGPVAVDSCPGGQEFGTGSTATQADYTGVTVGVGANRAMVATIQYSNVPVSPSVVWDPAGANQAFTLITSATLNSSIRYMEMWGLVNPVSGNKTLRFAWTLSRDVYVNGCSWTGVNQAGGTTSFPNAASTTPVGTQTSLSINITTAANHSVMAMWEAGDGAQTPSDTVIYNSGMDCCNAISNRANITSGSSKTLSNTWGSAATGFGIATDISP